MLINPPEDMKTSEYIREMLDSRLWHPVICESDDDRVDLNLDKYLCVLFQWAPTVCEEIRWELERQHAELAKTGEAAPNSILVRIYMFPNIPWDERDAAMQELRFMYADFLAYYFESIGD